MKGAGLLVLIVASLSFAQSNNKTQLTQPRPAVSRAEESASSLATGSLQSQIAELNRQVADHGVEINRLQEQIQMETIAGHLASSAAHTQGLWEGISIGVGATLLPLVLLFVVQRLREHSDIVKKPQTRAASA